MKKIIKKVLKIKIAAASVIALLIIALVIAAPGTSTIIEPIIIKSRWASGLR